MFASCSMLPVAHVYMGIPILGNIPALHEHMELD
jgi:hypothetical protein